MKNSFAANFVPASSSPDIAMSLPPVNAVAGSSGFGDLSLPAAMGVSGHAERVGAGLSGSGNQLNTWLGVTSGRISTGNYAVAQSMLEAFTQHLLLQTHLGVGVGQANTMPGSGSGRVPLLSPQLPPGGNVTYQPE